MASLCFSNPFPAIRVLYCLWTSVSHFDVSDILFESYTVLGQVLPILMSHDILLESKIFHVQQNISLKNKNPSFWDKSEGI